MPSSSGPTSLIRNIARSRSPASRRWSTAAAGWPEVSNQSAARRCSAGSRSAIDRRASSSSRSRNRWWYRYHSPAGSSRMTSWFRAARSSSQRAPSSEPVDCIEQWTRQTMEHRGLDHPSSLVVVERGEQLVGQVVGHQPVVAPEGPDEAVGIVAPIERQPGQHQARRPTLRAVAQVVDHARAQVGGGRAEQGRGLGRSRT